MDTDTSTSGEVSKKKKKSGISGKQFMGLMVVGLLVLTGLLESSRRQAFAQLKAMSVRMEQVSGGNTLQNKQEAERVVNLLRTHMFIPEDVQPTVATIVDVEKLRDRNVFYKNAKNGDHLVVTPERAILFDSKANVIIDVVPVQVKPAAEPAPAQEGEGIPAPEGEQPPTEGQPVPAGQ